MKRSMLSREALNLAPLRHENLELMPRVDRLPAREGDHSSAVLADGADFGAMALDRAVPSDDQPAERSYLRDPDGVLGRGCGDRASRPYPLPDRAAWVTGVGDVCAELRENLRQP